MCLIVCGRSLQSTSASFFFHLSHEHIARCSSLGLNKSGQKATPYCIHATAGVVYEDVEALQMQFDDSVLVIQHNYDEMLLLKVRVCRKKLFF